MLLMAIARDSQAANGRQGAFGGGVEGKVHEVRAPGDEADAADEFAFRRFRVPFVCLVDAVSDGSREEQAVEELPVMWTSGGLDEIGQRSEAITADTSDGCMGQAFFVGWRNRGARSR